MQAVSVAAVRASDHPDLVVPVEAYVAVISVMTMTAVGTGDPRAIAGPMWSLVHGVASLAIGGELHQVGIREDAESLAARALAELFEIAEPGDSTV